MRFPRPTLLIVAGISSDVLETKVKPAIVAFLTEAEKLIVANDDNYAMAA